MNFSSTSVVENYFNSVVYGISETFDYVIKDTKNQFKFIAKDGIRFLRWWCKCPPKIVTKPAEQIGYVFQKVVHEAAKMADKAIPTSSGAAKNLTHALFGHDTDDPREIIKNLSLALLKVGIIALIVVCILYLVFGIRRMINTLRYGGFAVGSQLSAEVGSINPDTLPIMPTQMHSKTLEKLKETVYIEPKKRGSVFMNEPEVGKDSLFQGIRKRQKKDIEKNLNSSDPNDFSKESIELPKEGEKVECSMNPIAPQMPITIAKIAHTETKKDVPISKEIKKSEVHQRTNEEVSVETAVKLTTMAQKLLEDEKKSNKIKNVPIDLDQKESSTTQPKSDDLFLSAKSEEKLQVEAQPKKSSPIKDKLITILPGVSPIRDETGYVKKLESPISPMRDESESIAIITRAVSPIRDESEPVIDVAKKSITESTKKEFKTLISTQDLIKTSAEKPISSENTGKKKDKISPIRNESEPSKKVVPPVSPMRDQSELVIGAIKKTDDKTIKEEFETPTDVQDSQTLNAIKTSAGKSIPTDDKNKEKISRIRDESVPTKIIPAVSPIRYESEPDSKSGKPKAVNPIRDEKEYSNKAVPPVSPMRDETKPNSPTPVSQNLSDHQNDQKKQEIQKSEKKFPKSEKSSQKIQKLTRKVDAPYTICDPIPSKSLKTFKAEIPKIDSDEKNETKKLTIENKKSPKNTEKEKIPVNSKLQKPNKEIVNQKMNVDQSQSFSDVTQLSNKDIDEHHGKDPFKKEEIQTVLSTSTKNEIPKEMPPNLTNDKTNKIVKNEKIEMDKSQSFSDVTQSSKEDVDDHHRGDPFKKNTISAPRTTLPKEALISSPAVATIIVPRNQILNPDKSQSSTDATQMSKENIGHAYVDPFLKSPRNVISPARKRSQRKHRNKSLKVDKSQSFTDAIQMSTIDPFKAKSPKIIEKLKINETPLEKLPEVNQTQIFSDMTQSSPIPVQQSTKSEANVTIDESQSFSDPAQLSKEDLDEPLIAVDSFKESFKITKNQNSNVKKNIVSLPNPKINESKFFKDFKTVSKDIKKLQIEKSQSTSDPIQHSSRENSLRLEVIKKESNNKSVETCAPELIKKPNKKMIPYTFAPKDFPEDYFPKSDPKSDGSRSPPNNSWKEILRLPANCEPTPFSSQERFDENKKIRRLSAIVDPIKSDFVLAQVKSLLENTIALDKNNKKNQTSAIQTQKTQNSTDSTQKSMKNVTQTKSEASVPPTSPVSPPTSTKSKIITTSPSTVSRKEAGKDNSSKSSGEFTDDFSTCSSYSTSGSQYSCSSCEIPRMKAGLDGPPSTDSMTSRTEALANDLQQLFAAQMRQKETEQVLGILPMNPHGSTSAGCQECQSRNLHPVTFRWYNDEPQQVYLSGSFVNWQAKIPMQKLVHKDNLFGTPTSAGFILRLKLPRGHHEYKFIVDRKWALDVDHQPVMTNKDGHVHHVIHV